MIKNRTLALGAIIMIMLFSFSCEKIKDEINEAAEFDVNQNLTDHYFTLDSNNYKSTAGINAWQILTSFEGYINVDSIFQANNLSSASINDGEFTNVTVSIVNPTPIMNLDFISEMRVTIAMSSSENGTIVATTGQIPQGSTSVTFTINETNIAPFINNNNFYIALEGDVVGQMPVGFIPMVLQSGVSFTVTPL
jgi:hypothetical protein